MIPSPSQTLMPPQLAGRFYPDQPEQLRNALSHAAQRALPAPVGQAKAVVMPHAGIGFCGPVAMTALGVLHPEKTQIRRLIILGPAHRMKFRGIAIPTVSAWQTPLGDVPLDWTTLSKLLPNPAIQLTNAPFQGEHAIEALLPYIQAAGFSVSIVPLLVGEATPQDVLKIVQDVWGDETTRLIISSDLSHFLPDEEARATDAATRGLIEQLEAEAITPQRACGHRPLAALLHQARRLDLRVTGLDLRTSADATGDTGRTVGYGAFACEYARRAHLPEASRQLLIDTAHLAIEFGLRHARKPALTATGISRDLTALRACFVTLKREGTLRGCVGSYVPHRPLLADVASNAWSAAFNDPRFSQLTEQDKAKIGIEISILSHPRRIIADREHTLVSTLDPDRDGLLLRDGPHQALFLPQVWEGIPDPKEFVKALRRKSGLPSDHWSDTLTFHRFSVEKISGPPSSPDTLQKRGHQLTFM